MQNDSAQKGLKPKSLGVSDIVFFVIAAAAPLGATLGAGPVVFAMGGAGAPGIYLIASLVLLLFAIGFAAMSRHVISAGGFAELVTHGLGRPAGNAAGGIALLAYVAMLTGIYGQFAAFGADLISSFAGFQMDWRIVAVLVIGLVGIFGYMDVKVSAKVLGVLMVFEILVLIVFDVAVIAQTEAKDFTWKGFMPSDIFTPGMGVALMFAFCCFVGFESTTIYGEEAKNPNRTVPLATYVAIAIIGIFYTLTTWCLGLAYANSDVQAVAGADMINFVFNANTKYVGALSTEIMKLLVVTSVFAVLLSFHNALSRYLYALARSHFVPHQLCQVHPKHASPHVASVVLSGATVLVVGAFMISNADPIQHLYMWMVGLGTLAVLALQTLGAAAVVGFTLKTRKCSVWQGLIAPALGGFGLLAAVILAVQNFGELTGTKEGLVTLFPWLVLLAASLGVINGMRAKGKFPVTPALS
ncbi:APC family permease [Pseudomonas sp. S32]|uniref:APC family permease n=1 Tax=Pseudomonas sp. S32 TaxID=2767448 RepID=UPI00191262F9|nr:APC family permease [Pseudomonas sp. S32]MBK5003811.1 APC family permease [Pseudomonas sp. S32]